MSSPDTQDTRRKLLEANIKSGSGWLWSVAGVSLLNTLVRRAGREYTFCVGLMFTQVSDYGSMQYAKEAGAAANPWVTVAALVFDALMIGGAALVARACDRRCGWIVIAGLLIYA